MKNKRAVIIGGGVAGLAAAVELAKHDIETVVIEKSSKLGGHAGYFTCKASEKCVKCGACIVEEKIKSVVENSNIKIIKDAVVKNVSHLKPFNMVVEQNGNKSSITADAIIISTGFKPFNPESKPYGYKKFANVITNLELETILREQSLLKKPSSGEEPKKIAFIQCVGSRDASLNHLWCSKVCCGSSLRMAMLIKSKRPQTEIAFFYIDIQTFGKDFAAYYERVKNDINIIRSIPADIFKTDDDQLLITYFDKSTDKSIEELYDIVVLSVGITPNKTELFETLNIKASDTEFISKEKTMIKEGVFIAGTVSGAMSIEESVSDASIAALDVIKYLKEAPL